MATAGNETELAAWNGVTNLTITSNIYITSPWSMKAIGAAATSTLIEGNYFNIYVQVGSWPGLFIPNNVTSNLTIQNLFISFPNSTTLSDQSGAFIGNCAGISNYTLLINTCSVSGNLTLGLQSAGLVGNQVSGTTINNCFANVNSPIRNSGGGIAGRQFAGTISNCYTSMEIRGSCGGIVGTEGQAGTLILNCYSIGQMTDASTSDAGGIAGTNFAGTIQSCYSAGSSVGSGGSNGGIAGSGCTGILYNCYSAGTVGSGSGALVGNANGCSLTDCFGLYATSAGVGSQRLVASGPCTITNCGFGNGTWTTSTILSNSWLVNNVSASGTIVAQSLVWADTNYASPPVLDAPFLLRTFTQYPWQHTSFNSNQGFNVTFPCIFAGAEIRTKEGWIRIENLKVGDLVLTLGGDYRPIKMIGRGTVDLLKNVYSSRLLLKNCLGDHLPYADTYITRKHSLLFKEGENVEESKKIISEYANKRYWEEIDHYKKWYVIPGYQKLMGLHCKFGDGASFNQLKSYFDPLGIPLEMAPYYHLVLEGDNSLSEYGIYVNGVPMETMSEAYFMESNFKSINI